MRTILSIASVISFIVLFPSALKAQGSLTPPGAPAPTMKSLDQIEARTPIAYAGYSITASGSYYLTTNLVTANEGSVISIYTNGVTIDLKGFTIFSTTPSASGTAIVITGSYSDITILNGHIVSGVTNNDGGYYGGPGFAYGIFSQASAPNLRVSDVSVSGCLVDGINLGDAPGTVVDSCAVQDVGGQGIVASAVIHSRALSCGSTAVSADSVSASTGQCIGDGGDGIVALYGADNSIGRCVGGNGLYLLSGAVINCWGQSGDGTGIFIESGTVTGCSGQSGGGDGIFIVNGTVNNCSGYSGSGVGINATENDYISANGGIVNGSYGISQTGDGIDAQMLVNGSVGISQGNGEGISCQTTVISSVGYAYGSGVALVSTICVGSWGYDPAGNGSVSANNKYNMP